ncbi:hypothetical protein K2173_027533 [Erythroxylum novogranatense]|uniref:Uncharacterized protein n=1 Tax=Erythroxylum novogranatense TaxID=1862640 RepID=A0AAV8TZD5_9ROSI|nr:hypothetical protein K2173_027533 [Erythroxylum novogranatense]
MVCCRILLKNEAFSIDVRFCPVNFRFLFLGVFRCQVAEILAYSVNVRVEDVEKKELGPVPFEKWQL